MAERWVALLRGINVGGAHRLAMADLRASMTDAGIVDAVTYLQSGNVVFDLAADDPEAVSAVVADILAGRHGLEVPVVVRRGAELSRIATTHPDDGAVDAKFLHVVFFDREPPVDRLGSLDRSRFEPDSFVVDGREAYVTYPQGSGRSRLMIDVFERALGVTATARNMNTVRKLAELAGGSRPVD